MDIPGLVVVKIDETLIPPGPQGPAGPPGGKVVQTWFTQVTNDPSTNSLNYTTVLSSPSITLSNAANKVVALITINMGVTALNITTLSLFRDNVDLTPAGRQGHLQMRPVDISALYPASIIVEDTPGSVGPFTYSLKWKVNQSTSWLGKRGADSSLQAVGATMYIMEIAA